MARQARAKWTFMVYMAGFNNLSEFATSDLAEMEAVGSNDDVQIAVFIKRLGRDSAERLIVGGDAEQIGDADSGDPQTLLDFVRWAVAVAPAERYALTVWNHGSGWDVLDLDQLYQDVRGQSDVTLREIDVLRSDSAMSRTLFKTPVRHILAMPTAHDRAIASDDGTGHSLDTIELGNVLAKAAEEIGAPLDVLGMDACLMSNLEVAYQARQHVRHIVGSEELEPGDGWPYTAILQDLVAKPDMDGAELGATIVRRYIESYEPHQGQWPVTQCVVAADAIGSFADTLDDLGGALSEAVADSAQRGEVFAAHASAARFHGELTDLRTFCVNLQGSGVADAVKEGAARVVDALAPNGYVVAEGHLGSTVDGCGGVTAYMPSPADSISRYYADLRFAEQHRWDEFLGAYQQGFRRARA